jgi:organic radical activating enzyme
MFEKAKKYFPIKQFPACPLKWTWSTIWLKTAETASCFRCEKLKLTQDNFKDFHNLPNKVKEREIMLSGKWPTVENGGAGYCNYCKKIEDAGGTSDRMHHLTIPNLSPRELDEDLNSTSVTPKILEVFLNNTCNLKCTYCRTNDSSQIESEIQKFGDMTDLQGNTLYGFKKRENIPNNTEKFLPLLIEWLQKNGKKLRRLHFLGGETFYQRELQVILDVLKTIKNKHLELNIVSNLMVKENNFKNYIEQFEKMIRDKNIGRFDLTASIDGWGPEAEYARFGLKCDYFLKLFDYSCKKKWMKIHVNQTISSLTLNSVPELIKIIKNYQAQRPIEMFIGLVINRPWMHPSVYGKGFWSEYFHNILSILPEENYRQKTFKNYVNGVYKSLPDRDPDQKQVAELKHFLNQLDQRRNTNWREIYPYLDI